MHLSIFISAINQLDAQKFRFTVSLFHASTCFEHMCWSSGVQNCITQPLVSSHLYVTLCFTYFYMFRAHVLIIRRSQLHYTASGIITAIGDPLVHMPLHVSSTFAHHQEVTIALYSLWYHHTYRWPSRSHASTCFEHICSSSRGQNCITQPLVSSHL